MTMGKQNTVDKAIRPLTLTSITPAGVIPDATRAGVIPVGNYKGVAAFWDLDKAVNQPLVAAESRYILGMLDGRTANYDYVYVPFVLGDLVAATRRARLTVPAGELWYIHAVQIYATKDATCTYDVNFRCSLWPDRAAVPDADGQTFLPTDGIGTNAINIWNWLFGVVPVATNIGIVAPAGVHLGIAIGTPKALPTMLRLPAGATLTAQVTVRTAVFAASTVAMGVTGYVARALVA